jgi:hypothetical protein
LRGFLGQRHTRQKILNTLRGGQSGVFVGRNLTGGNVLGHGIVDVIGDSAWIQAEELDKV